MVDSDLTEYLNKRVLVTLNGRKVEGTLKGYDAFMNIVLETAVEVKETPAVIGTAVIRGEAVVSCTLVETA